MSEHFIDWYLVDPVDDKFGDGVGPHARLTCAAPPDAPCHDLSWEEVVDTSGFPIAENECYATVMIELAGAAHVWAGAMTHQISGREIDVKTVGDDFVWKYVDEKWVEKIEVEAEVQGGDGSH